METLTRLVAESLARHGFDRPVDYRRLQWSRWFRCESHHSLLLVPSKPGVFALAKEIMDLGATPEHVGTADLAVQQPRSEAKDSTDVPVRNTFSASGIDASGSAAMEELRFSAAPTARGIVASGPVAPEPVRRMLAVSQFFEDDDMAFVLDRMLSRENPMRARLTSGRYFVRYVVIEDTTQRRSICNALNQWIVSSAEKATGIGSHFATSLELAPISEQTLVATAASAVEQTPRVTGGSASVQNAVEEWHFSAASEAQGDRATAPVCPDVESRKPEADPRESRVNTAPTLNSAIATNIRCSSSFPSGF